MIVSITMYTGTIGAPLFCGGTYDPAQSWVAWDFAVNGGQCDDIIRITTLDGTVYEEPARDSGKFGHHCVRQLDGTCPRIAVDVPQHLAWFPGLSTLPRTESRGVPAMTEIDKNTLECLLNQLCSDQDSVTHLNENHGTPTQMRQAQAQRTYTKARIIAFVEFKARGAP